MHGLADRAALRRALFARRRALAPEHIARASQSITEHILATDTWRRASSVAAFVGVRNEPDTTALLDAAWSSGKQLYLPRVEGEVIGFVPTPGRDRLVDAGFGLREPVGDSRSLADVAPALVLVPGLGFSRTGARIGFGRAYYDRALAPIRDRSDIVRMGICFAAFLDPIEGPIPMADHDVPMHAIATELGVI